MLFLLRPRQTRMPYAYPRENVQQNYYNQQLRDAYGSTRRVAPYALATPAAEARDPVADLKELAQLHQSGALTDAEFALAKAKVLERDDEPK